MKVLLSSILILAVTFGSAARMSNLGWLFVFGLASIGLFGLVHIVTQTKMIARLKNISGSDIALIGLSHLTYLGSLIFQSDGGDDGSHIAIERFLNVDIFDSYRLPINLTWTFISLFWIVTAFNIRRLRNLKQGS